MHKLTVGSKSFLNEHSFYYLNFSYIFVRMTLFFLCKLSHNLPAFTLDSKPATCPFRKFLSVMVNWVKVVKNCKILIFKVYFLFPKMIRIFLIFFIENYHFRCTFFDHFKFSLFISKNDVQFLTNFTQIKNLLIG